MKKENWVFVHDQIWWKIRYYQKSRRITDTDLAKIINVSVRTLKDYDSNPRTLSLEQVNDFLYVYNLKLLEFINLPL